MPDSALQEELAGFVIEGCPLRIAVSDGPDFGQSLLAICKGIVSRDLVSADDDARTWIGIQIPGLEIDVDP